MQKNEKDHVLKLLAKFEFSLSDKPAGEKTRPFLRDFRVADRVTIDGICGKVLACGCSRGARHRIKAYSLERLGVSFAVAPTAITDLRSLKCLRSH